jgi:predicted metalloendopeptidase
MRAVHWFRPYEAFGVEPGEALYLPPDERVRIW